ESERVAAPAAGSGVGAATRVRVPSRGSNRPASDEQAWAVNQPLIHRRLESPVGAARIADRGEASVEHSLQGDHCAGSHQGERNVLELAEEHLAQDDMSVAIDEPGHQRAPAAIDGQGILRPDGPFRDLADALALDQDFAPAYDLVPLGVEHPDV